MKSVLPYLLFMVCEILAVIAFQIWDRPILAAAFALLGVLIWFAAPPILGKVPRKDERREHLDPAELKQYRKDHPGSTIGDAMRDPHRAPEA